MKLFQTISVSLLLALGIILSGCETFCSKCSCDDADSQTFTINDTIEMRFGEVYCNPDYKIGLSFESFIEGRCPAGVICVWEGNAQLTFDLEDKNEGFSEFVLNTYDGFLSDTVIHGLRYELIDLEPYPDIDVDYPQEQYTATVLISD
jgi:hypothetical protein